MAFRVPGVRLARTTLQIHDRCKLSSRGATFLNRRTHESRTGAVFTTSIPSCPSMELSTNLAQHFLPSTKVVRYFTTGGPHWRARGLQTQAIAEELQVDRLTDEDTGIIVFSLNRPKAKNAIGNTLLQQLRRALQAVQTDSSARVIVFRSLVAGVFCAGADLKERRVMSAEEASEFVKKLRGTFTNLATLPVPTIAAVEGKALGGGLELALACDMRIGGREAVFQLPETGLAIIPGAGGTQRLPRVVGVPCAKELIFTGQPIGAARAERIGLLNHVVADGRAYEESLQMARLILRKGPLSLTQAKVAIDCGVESSMDDGLALEESCYSSLLQTKDRLEGLAAFQEKRLPMYVGK